MIAILYTIDDDGENDEELTHIINNLTFAKEANVPVNTTFHLNALLPAKRSYYTYKGSLTTPPCTETILWHVFDTPMKISSKVIDKIQEAVSTVDPTSECNTRLPQALNGRTVYYYDPEELL